MGHSHKKLTALKGTAPRKGKPRIKEATRTPFQQGRSAQLAGEAMKSGTNLWWASAFFLGKIRTLPVIRRLEDQAR